MVFKAEMTKMTSEIDIFVMYYTPGFLLVLKFNHVVDVSKIANFISVIALCHRQFVACNYETACMET